MVVWRGVDLSSVYYFPSLLAEVSHDQTQPIELEECLLGQVKKTHVSRRDFYKKESGRAGGFFCYLLFPIACFLYTLLPSPRDTLELIGQILIKRNIRY